MDTVKYKNKYRIATIRLKNYDYSQNGCYFVTICTKDKQKYFGNIENEKMVLNEIGEIVEKFWLEIPKHFPSVVLDEFVIMPNHVHGIIIINKLADEMPTLFAVETRHCLVSTTEKINRFQNQGKNTISSIHITNHTTNLLFHIPEA
jgi:REP element-mobilizing transposase RayT